MFAYSFLIINTYFLGSDSHVSERHRSDLVYTKAFLYEVMRIKPILPLSLTHATTCDTSVGE